MLCRPKSALLIRQNCFLPKFFLFAGPSRIEIRRELLRIQNCEKGHFRTISVRAHASTCGYSVLSCSSSRSFVHFNSPLSHGTLEARSLLTIHLQPISSESAVIHAFVIVKLIYPCPTRSISRAKVAARRLAINGGTVIDFSELWNHLRYAWPREVNNIFASAFRH